MGLHASQKAPINWGSVLLYRAETVGDNTIFHGSWSCDFQMTLETRNVWKFEFVGFADKLLYRQGWTDGGGFGTVKVTSAAMSWLHHNWLSNGHVITTLDRNIATRSAMYRERALFTVHRSKVKGQGYMLHALMYGLHDALQNWWKHVYTVDADGEVKHAEVGRRIGRGQGITSWWSTSSDTMLTQHNHPPFNWLTACYSVSLGHRDHTCCWVSIKRRAMLMTTERICIVCNVNWDISRLTVNVNNVSLGLQCLPLCIVYQWLTCSAIGRRLALVYYAIAASTGVEVANFNLAYLCEANYVSQNTVLSRNLELLCKHLQKSDHPFWVGK